MRWHLRGKCKTPVVLEDDPGRDFFVGDLAEGRVTAGPDLSLGDLSAIVAARCPSGASATVVLSFPSVIKNMLNISKVF